MNPKYHHVGKKSRRRLEAEKVIDKLGQKLSEEIEDQKVKNFLEIIKSGHRLSDD